LQKKNKKGNYSRKTRKEFVKKKTKRKTYSRHVRLKINYYVAPPHVHTLLQNKRKVSTDQKAGVNRKSTKEKDYGLQNKKEQN
jgi:hypothetical protein